MGTQFFIPFTTIRKVDEIGNEKPADLSEETMRKVIFWLTYDYKKKVYEYNEARKKADKLRSDIELYRERKNGLFYWLSCQELKEQKVRIKYLHKRIADTKFKLKYHCDWYSRMRNK